MKRWIPAVAALLSVSLLCCGCMRTVTQITTKSSGSLAERLNDTAAERDLGNTDGLTSLTLDIDMSQVVVQTGNDWKLESNFKDEYLTYEVKDGVLTVSQADVSWSIGDWSGKLNPLITLTVPKDARMDTLTAKLGAGTLDLNGLSVKDTEIKVDAGAVTLDALDTRVLDLKCNMGSVEGSAQLSKDSVMDVDMGSIDLTLLDGSKIARITTNVDMGSVSLDGKDVKDGTEQVTGTQGAAVTLKCDMGSIDLKTKG